jgi:Raf kinase inhibitor-like YbhB/YbcL family protein
MTEEHNPSVAQSPPAPLAVTSPILRAGEPMPARFTADGADESPPLAWGRPPASTRSFAVLCEDPDATSKGVFHHWCAWNIPADQRELHAGVVTSEDAADLRQGRNDFDATGYRGPKPPPDATHRYVFRVLALDVIPDLPTGSTRAMLDRAMEGHVVAQGDLVVPYRRRG